ncbi:probable methyltransferase TARBP1 isoform X2 [Thalassophryne amazonica]|uniref:probable methyltransferase TARBP1 isoform X2 n=1 Tax=Thalassophryne amazonica TaxID=390379 RepID=UPI0014714869|nr:probable methyltransferase TARBP1 isoform X2 [Thalassophryne amazonica]
MHSVLLNAVLSCSPDYDALFDALIWPPDTCPEPQRVEALTALIEGIEPLLTDSSAPDVSPIAAETKQRIIERIESVIWTRCVPLLSAEAGQLQRRCTAAVCALLSACVPLCAEDAAGRLVLAVLSSLQVSHDDLPASSGPVSAEVASDVIAALLPSQSSNEQLVLRALSAALSCIKTLPDALVSRVTARLLLTFLNCCSGSSLGVIQKLILDDLCHWHACHRSPVVTERALLCLTVLSDHLFTPRGNLPDPRQHLQFWRMVQDGLMHRDSVSRKRALFLLKRCVALSEEEGINFPLHPSEEDEILFKWAIDKIQLLRDFWQDYVLVMETLEESQVHVVRPVLNRIDTLIQATQNDCQASGWCLFHPSWLLSVYQRMFHSENKSLMREGVCHLLQLQVLQQPDFALAFSQFIVNPFMDVLCETSLFHRGVGQSVGDCPELGAKLHVFMATFFDSLPSEHHGCVLLQLIQHLGSKHWCAVPLLFLSQALSKLSLSPLLGVEGLAALREVLRCSMITHQVLLRAAAQCFLLNSALSLTDVSTVTLDDVFSFLMYFRTDESLCRGTLLWNQLRTWLLENESHFKPLIGEGRRGQRFGEGCAGTNTRKDGVRAYVEEEIYTYLKVPASTGQTERLPDGREADKLARAILLCVDMETSRPGGDVTHTLESLLFPLLDTLSRLSMNIYLPLRKSDKSLQLMLQLLELLRTPECRDVGEEENVKVAMEKIIHKIVDPVQDFVLRRLCGEMQELFDVERAKLYLCVLRQLSLVQDCTPQCRQKHQDAYFSKLIKCSLRILQESNQQIPSIAVQVAKAVGMASLATVCSLVEQRGFDVPSESVSGLKLLNDYFYSPASSFSSQSPSSVGHFNQTLVKPDPDTLSDVEAEGPLLQDWGRIAAHFMRDQWICLSFLIRDIGVSESVEDSETLKTLAAALSCCVEALALLPSDLVLPVFTFMERVLPQLVRHDESLCVAAVSLSWELVQGLSTNAHDFWPVLKGFVSVAFHRDLLELTEKAAPKLTFTVKQVASELMELSQSKSGVLSVLLQHCCQTWLPTDGSADPRADTTFCSVLNHINILAEACVYGPVMRRDQRLIQDVQTYVEKLGDECTANAVVTWDNRDDQSARTYVLAFLSQLDSSKVLHVRLMETLVIDLLKKDNDITKSKLRYYSNSLQHRVKNRIWQTLLLLLPKLKEEFVGSLLPQVFESGLCSNQPSVKYLIEWMMILILERHPQHIDSFWACFSMDQEKTKTSICTFLSVLVHLNIIIPKLVDKSLHLRKALDVILQWCFNHNFSVRLYALLALKRVWSLAEIKTMSEEGSDGLGGVSTVIEACLKQAEVMQSSGNANKNWTRIQEHFFFGAFHPVRDYSVETIFYTFPSLSEVADDEWIPPWKFEKLSHFSDDASLPLRNAAPDLSQLQPRDWIQQDKSEQDKEERWAEVQKKITPWRLKIQEQEPELQLVPQQRAARVGKLHGALLVVASLIDKPTNLGGLCRTCEIFGARALVLDSFRHVGDKHFQSLSVSSELWLPLLEVKPVELGDFLQMKKAEGYCVIGVEQTANSQSLQDYQFPEKTLLLLGNEREGIPANFLQLLDVCVEIPQQGVIRSLNVHVSAALLIWEYTRQHLAKSSSEPK